MQATKDSDAKARGAAAHTGEAIDPTKENAYLRTVLQQLRALAGENLELQRRVVLLENVLTMNGIVIPDAVDAAAPAVVSSGSDRQNVIRRFAERFVPASADEFPVLVIGPSHVDPAAWPAFGLPELTDICYGMMDEAAISFMCGPVSDRLLRQFAPLKNAYQAQVVDLKMGDTITPALWSEAVSAAIDAVRPTLTLVLALSPGWEQAIVAAQSIGSKIVLFCSKNELNDLVPSGRAYAEAPRISAEALCQCDLVLVTSHWESELIASVCGERRPRTELYIRGVDLTKFVGAKIPGEKRFNVLLVVDRCGPVGLHRFQQAAELLANSSEIGFSILAPFEIPVAKNVKIYPPLLRDDRIALYKSTDIIVLPDECNGFAQSIMEAMASSCACVASLESLGGYGESNGIVACDLSAEQLAHVIMALGNDPVRLAALQLAAKAFAENLFARSNWAGWLQQFLRSQLT